MATLALAAIIAMTLFVILDLDRPRVGMIHITPDSLVRQQASMQDAS
jgi:hypothetical protein